jgi:hypothetical protein
VIRKADKELKYKWSQVFSSLPPDSKAALKSALYELHKDSLQKANHSWKKHKAPMALYWKVVGVYAGHLSRAIK